MCNKNQATKPNQQLNIYNGVIFPSLNHATISIPNEPRSTSSSAVGQISCAVINTSNEVKCPLLPEFWIYNFSRRILERVFVRRIVNITNECLFSGFMGNESERGTNKSPKAICLSRAPIHSPCTHKKDTHTWKKWTVLWINLLLENILYYIC